MNPITPQDELQFKLARIVATALLVLAPLTYLTVANTMSRDTFQAEHQATLITYILIAIALIDPALWYIIRKSLIGNLKSSNPEINLAKRYFSLMTIKLALVAADFVYGMVAFLITNDRTNMIWFYLIGAVWSFLFWPRRSHFERVMNEGLEVI